MRNSHKPLCKTYAASLPYFCTRQRARSNMQAIIQGLMALVEVH
jgi:hypothetical protein